MSWDFLIRGLLSGGLFIPGVIVQGVIVRGYCPWVTVLEPRNGCIRGIVVWKVICTVLGLVNFNFSKVEGVRDRGVKENFPPMVICYPVSPVWVTSDSTVWTEGMDREFKRNFFTNRSLLSGIDRTPLFILLKNVEKWHILMKNESFQFFSFYCIKPDSSPNLTLPYACLIQSLCMLGTVPMHAWYSPYAC